MQLGPVTRINLLGNCRFSDVAVFSFHPVKIITTGEGGAVTTRDPALAARMARLRSHGITKDPEQFELESAGPWSYEQQELGFNYRLTDIQAALGLSQLQRLEAIVEERNPPALSGITEAFIRQSFEDSEGACLHCIWPH